MAQRPVLAVRNITKRFSGTAVLDRVSCAFHRSQVHCIVGENGAGKSTLIKIMSGAYTADEGVLELDGREIQSYSPIAARRAGINAIYQEIDLVPNLSACENIFLGNEPTGLLGRIDRKALVRRSREVLAEMGVDIDVEVEVQQFSLAQQQIISIAKALTMQSSLIILDEPTAVFTRQETDQLFDLVRRLKEDRAIVFISHHLDEIFEIGDVVTVLRDGSAVSTGPIAEYDHDRLVRDMVGRDIDTSGTQRPARTGPVALDVVGLADGGAVADATFNVRSGEIVCLAGLVGAGRSETARMIIGADRRAGGKVTLNGQPFAPSSPSDALGDSAVMLPEDRKRDGLALRRSAAENLGYAFVERSHKHGLISWSKVARNVTELMQRLQVSPNRPTQPADQFSGGNQQKLVLGRLIMVEPDLLILDEPTRGVDVGARQQIYDNIRELSDDGKAILLISSDLEEVLAMADRVVVMAKGRVTGELQRADATEEAIMRLAFDVAEAEAA